MFLSTTQSFAAKPIRYVALGDSYTIGTGASPEESWPAVVTKQLKAKGKKIELVANLAQNGWTSKDLMLEQLPRLKQIKPNFITLLIGTNDWVQGIPNDIYQQNVQYILEHLLDITDAKNILVLTLPDFSFSPSGQQYSNGRDISKGLAEFNAILKIEANARHIQVVDLYPLSQTLKGDVFSSDGLHPSAKGYAKWAELIEPNFLK
jgi:acyl-CoA thioesterase-1